MPTLLEDHKYYPLASTTGWPATGTGFTEQIASADTHTGPAKDHLLIYSGGSGSIFCGADAADTANDAAYLYTATDTATNKERDITIVGSGSNSGSRAWWIIGAYYDSSNYIAVLATTAGDVVRLYKYVGGTATQLGSDYTGVEPNGANIVLKIREPTSGGSNDLDIAVDVGATTDAISVTDETLNANIVASRKDGLGLGALAGLTSMRCSPSITSFKVVSDPDGTPSTTFEVNSSALTGERPGNSAVYAPTETGAAGIYADVVFDSGIYGEIHKNAIIGDQFATGKGWALSADVASGIDMDVALEWDSPDSNTARTMWVLAGFYDKDNWIGVEIIDDAASPNLKLVIFESGTVTNTYTSSSGIDGALVTLSVTDAGTNSVDIDVNVVGASNPVISRTGESVNANIYGSTKAGFGSGDLEQDGSASSRTFGANYFLVTEPDGGTTHDLTINDLSHSNTLDANTLVKVLVTVVNELSHSNTLDAISVAKIAAMAAADLTHGNTLDADAIALTVGLSPSELTHSNTLDSPAAGLILGLTLDELSHGNTLDSSAVARAIGLTIDELSHSNTLDADALAVTFGIAPAQLDHSNTLDAAALGVIFGLGINALAAANTLDSPALAKIAALTVNELLSSNTLDDCSVNTALNLVVDELSSAHSLDGVTVSRIRGIVINELLSANTLDAAALGLIAQLAVADLTHSNTLDTSSTSAILGLTIDDLLSSNVLDSITITDAGTRRIVTVNGVKIDLTNLAGVKIDQLSLTGIKPDQLNLTGKQ